MGLDLGCSTQWLRKSQMGRGRRVPQGKERECWCWALQSGQLPDHPDEIISTSPAFPFFKS